MEFSFQIHTEKDFCCSPETYLYRADGVKLKKTYNLVNQAGSKVINTEYLDGFQYSTPNTEPIRRALEETDDATMSARTAGNEEAFLPLEDRLLLPDNPNEEMALTLSFFPTAEGYYDYENFRYIYQYKDHLGNVRVSYVKNSVGGLQVMDTNDYYPFGLSFLKPFGQSSAFDPMTIPYNYKYNGKELQETGMYDYGARFYMPDIGRWGVGDPLAESSRSWNPYNYTYNNPVNFVDPDGREGVGWGLGSDNAWHWQSDLTADNYTTRGFTDYRDDGSIIEDSAIQGQESSNTGRTYLGFNGQASYVGANSQSAASIAIPLGGYVGTGASGTAAVTGAAALRLILGASAIFTTLVGDTPIDIPAERPNNPNNLYLYRNMRSVGNIPQLGNSLNTLGVRNDDFSKYIFGQSRMDSDYVFGSSGEGMSVTPGYGNIIPITPFKSNSTTLFRIKATDIFKSGLGINVDAIDHANITPLGRTTLQNFRLQIQATAPLWKPIR